MIDYELVAEFLNAFNLLYKRDIRKLKELIFDDEYINKRVKEVEDHILLEELDLDNKNELIKKIKAAYKTIQDDGILVVDDYEHFDDWYEQLEIDNLYWDRYRLHLLNQELSPNVVDHLNKNTLKNLMSYLGNPNADEPFSRKGLVIGDVQSGKTLNYLGLICKAVDAGYKVVFLLTGTTEALRQQTQIRVEEGFIGWDSANGEEVGVGVNQDVVPVPHAYTSRVKDFTKDAEKTSSLLIQEKSKEPFIFIIKKNMTVLKKIYLVIKNNLKGTSKKVKFPMLMIDDEADNASINTKKEGSAPINRAIRDILGLFEKSNYVGFTATPFANIFIDPDTDDDMERADLFPKDFIYALNAPSNYNGAKRMFIEKGENSDRHMLQFLDADEESIENLKEFFPIDHKNGFRVQKLPNTVYEAINRFFLVNTIRDLTEEDKTTHRSMLINMTRFISVQEDLKDIVSEYVKKVIRDIRQSFRLKTEAIKNNCVFSLYQLFKDQYKDFGVTWDAVLENIYESIENIKVVMVNSSKEAGKLNYLDHKNGFRVIAIGGNALSRGMTLEGLMISYFYRNSATFDVLMQMGRWFGYRNDYKDLCKVYITKISASYYREIIESTEELKNDMRRMCEKKLKPIEYGIRVRNDFYNTLRITASNKMRNTDRKTIRKHFWGEMFQTPFLNYGEDNLHNIELTKLLISNNTHKQDKAVLHPYFRNIQRTEIISFLNKLNIDPNVNDSFNSKMLLDFACDIELDYDVLIMEGSKETVSFCDSININLSKRQYDMVSNTNYIRLNHYRLGAPTDTAYGLNKDTIDKINIEYETRRDKNFLIEERNPLLMVYLIKPSNKFEESTPSLDDETFNDFKNVLGGINEKQKQKELEFETELGKSENPYLIGFQLGFPRRDNIKNETHRYVTNINADFYKSHNLIQGDDGEDE